MLTDTLKKLVSIPSVLGQEEEVYQYARSYVEPHADRILEVGSPGDGHSFIAWKDGSSGAPTVVLNGHLDTVPPAAGWEEEAFAPRVEEDRLYGLGASDMKAGVAILMELFRNYTGNANIILTLVTDEEGNSLGAYRVLKEGISGDLCLVPEPTDEHVMLGCRGRYVLDIVVRGRAAHGARPYLGINAINDAARIVTALERIRPRSHRLLGRGSCCVLKIRGGGDTLSVPEVCTVRFDRHVVPGETEDMVLEDIRKAVSAVHIQSHVDIKWMERPTPFLRPYVVEKKGLVRAFLFTYQEVYGRWAEEVYGESVGDYNLFAERMPTLVCGPCGKNWHSRDEYVEIPSVKRVYSLYSSFLRSL